MSLFGSSPPNESPDQRASSSLFEDEPPMTRSTTTALFADDDAGSDSPWDMPTPRKPQTRADVVRSLLPASEVPDSYIEAFDTVVAQEGGSAGRITAGGVARTLAAAKLGADTQARIMGIVVPGRGEDEDVALDRNQFNVLLALIGLAQEGEGVSLDGVDERRRGE
jgi:sorting nexin-8